MTAEPGKKLCTSYRRLFPLAGQRPNPERDQEPNPEPDRRVTTLELFFDPVFDALAGVSVTVASVIAIGIGIGDLPLTAGLFGGAFLSLALATALWWTYFVRDEELAEEVFRATAAPVALAAALLGVRTSAVVELLALVAVLVTMLAVEREGPGGGSGRCAGRANSGLTPRTWPVRGTTASYAPCVRA